LPCDFVVHPIRWDRCPLVAADSHARAWVTLQSHRGLAYNTLDAYSRGLERYFLFLTQLHFSCASVTSTEVGLYLASLQANGSRLSNATMQQLLTVIRLFHAYLMEEGVRVNNPAAHSHIGRPLIARHHKLPWIPNEDDWHSVLAAARHEPIRNRVMLAFAYDAGLRREELALLAGISSDYYVRLEQGRDKHPSPEVINALAGALKLDVKATEYLHQLAAPRAARTPLRNSEAVPDGAEELIDQFPMPAIIANRYLDVLAAIRSLTCYHLVSPPDETS